MPNIFICRSRSSNITLSYNGAGSLDIPESFDWRDKGAVTAVRSIAFLRGLKCFTDQQSANDLIEEKQT